MSKPIVKHVLPFDADKDYTFHFSYTEHPPKEYRLLILDAGTNGQHFKSESVGQIQTDVQSQLFYHTLHPSEPGTKKLTNGTSYSVQVSVMHEDHSWSSLSDKIYFTCYAAPEVTFSDLKPPEIQNNVSGDSYPAAVTYSQSQGRPLKEYRFELYDGSANTLIESSGLINCAAGESSIPYTYKNLENDHTYYIRFIGYTVDGVEADTGKILLYVKYAASSVYPFEVRCDEEGGYIQCSTHIKSIEGIPEPGDGYILSDGIADLTNASVTYKDGILINGDLLIGITASDMTDNETIFQMGNKTGDFIALSHHIYEKQHLIRLTILCGLEHSVLYSDLFSLSNGEQITIYIKRINHLYDLILKRKEDTL